MATEPMEERTIKLENAYYKNVLYVIEELLGKIPHPAHVDEKPASKSITEYFFKEPMRTDSYEKQERRITITYSQTERTQFGIMAGIVLDKEPIVFECYQDRENNSVGVKGYCSTRGDSADWIMTIFGNIWQLLLDRFSD